MNVVFVAPYSAKLIKAIVALEKIKLGKIDIVGDYEKISFCVKENRLKIHTLITNISEEEDISLYLIEKKFENSLIVFGDYSLSYQMKLYNIKSDDSINYLHVVDLPELRHFLFICNQHNKRHYQINDKKQGIITIFKFMNSLGIKRANVAMITENSERTDTLETNLIRMILKEELSKNINIMNPCSLSDVFNPNSPCNVFNKNVNMIMFKNYDNTRMFIETLSVFGNCKIASICHYQNSLFLNNLFLNTNEQKDEQDILFSILLVSKYHLSSQYPIEKNIKYAKA